MSQLYEDMAEAMKRRTRAQNALVKWEEALHDAESDIREMSARIAAEHGSFIQVPSAPGADYDIPVTNSVEEI